MHNGGRKRTMDKEDEEKLTEVACVDCHSAAKSVFFPVS